jgi:hypothetical protein
MPGAARFELQCGGPGRHGVRRRRGGKTPIVKARLTVVVEVAADAALQAGDCRHPLRLVRHRSDLDPADVETLPAG